MSPRVAVCFALSISTLACTRAGPSRKDARSSESMHSDIPSDAFIGAARAQGWTYFVDAGLICSDGFGFTSVACFQKCSSDHECGDGGVCACEGNLQHCGAHAVSPLRGVPKEYICVGAKPVNGPLRSVGDVIRNRIKAMDGGAAVPGSAH